MDKRYPGIARSKPTSSAPSCSRALKRSRLSVHNGTITHARSISGSSPSVAEKRTLRRRIDYHAGRCVLPNTLGLPRRRGPGCHPHLATKLRATSHQSSSQRRRLLTSWCGSPGKPCHCRNCVRPAVRASGGHRWEGTACRLPPRLARQTGGTRQPARL
jgi:hypothetical protein